MKNPIWMSILIMRRLGVKAVACFPLIVAEQAVGLLYIYLHEERQFTHLEQLMLDNFVNQAAMAIYHARRLAGRQARSDSQG